MGAGKLSLLSALASRLYYLQVIKTDQYRTLSENNSIKALMIPALRGNITDCYGSPLAINQNHYRVMIEKNAGYDFKSSLLKLCNLLTISDQEKAYIIKKTLQQKSSQPILVYSPLTWQDVVNIEVNSHDLPGVYVDVGQVRFYPFSNLCAHIIGYVATPTEQEVAKHPFLSHPDIKIGKNGIEKIFDNYLSGTPGIKRMEVNAYGLSIRELSREEASPGKDLALTIDVGLQDFLTNKLEAKGAAAVVIDITNGNIIAMNSTPTFDPNQFTQGVSAKYWNDLIEDPYSPMTNKTISSQYPPGSIFKLIVGLSALMDGITPDFTVHCPGYVIVGDRKFHCWKDGGHGTLNFEQAIVNSCNCYFYTLARRLGIDKFVETAKLFGLGSKTNIELPNEKPGFLPGKRWKLNRFRKEWQVGDTLNSAIGQGFLLATPIQLALMAARIASGKDVQSTLISSKEKELIFNDLDIDKKYLDLIRNGMVGVANTPTGTAYGSRIFEANFQIAIKTGTSQVISKKNEKDDFSKASTEWKNKNHGLCISYGPVHKPRYACSVMVEHGGSGSGAAAPVAKEIFLELNRIFKLAR
jgi:penicillin-binding protein 2